MKNTIKPTVETGAMTLVLLVTNYRSQMIALLLKNGVTVANNASTQQIATTMGNLLKVSKSFAKDLKDFISNPSVLQVLAGELQQNAQYFRASGSGYMNFTDTESDDPENSDPALPTPTTPAKKTGFFSGLNLGKLITDGLDTFTKADKNKTDREIARLRASIEGGKNLTDEEVIAEVEKKEKAKNDEGMSTTTIVVLSLVGVALIGTVIYFVTRPKN